MDELMDGRNSRVHHIQQQNHYKFKIIQTWVSLNPNLYYLPIIVRSVSPISALVKCNCHHSPNTPWVLPLHVISHLFFSLLSTYFHSNQSKSYFKPGLKARLKFTSPMTHSVIIWQKRLDTPLSTSGTLYHTIANTVMLTYLPLCDIDSSLHPL